MREFQVVFGETLMLKLGRNPWELSETIQCTSLSVAYDWTMNAVQGGRACV